MGSLTLVQALADATTPLNLDTINAGAAPDDWALWTTDFLTPAQRKSGGGSTISAAFVGAATQSSTTDARTISWTNGMPTASGSSALCVFNSSFASGNGHAITLPATTTPRRAWILVSPYNTPVHNLNISLTDGSATPIATTITGVGGTFNPFTIIIDYQADTTTTLVVSFSEQATAPQTVCLQAAAWAASGPAPSLEQEGFRFGIDEANEAGHTWSQNQDTDDSVSIGTSRLLRMLINATLDPASAAYTLRYQKNGSGGYVAVPVGASITEDIGTTSYSAIGTGTNATSTTSHSVNYPSMTGATARTALYLVLTGVSSTAGTEFAVTGGGWTKIGALEGGTGTFGVDTGQRRVTIFRKDSVSGSESGTITVTLAGTTTNTMRGSIIRVEPPDQDHVIEESFASGADTTNDTSYSATAGSNQTYVAGDLVLVATAQNIDTGTLTSVSLTATGVTFGTVTNRASTAITGGNDHRHLIYTVPVNSVTGTPNVAAVWSYTISAAGSGPTAFLRIRARRAAVTNEVYVSASANIASGGEATTARLTAPSGKTSSSFTTGRRWDDENGTDSIDIASDFYTELEWSLQQQAPAANGDYYEFRVYSGSTALGTYTLTPKLTVTSAGGGASASPTGVAGTGAVGTLTANGSASKAITGVSGTGSAGTITQTHAASIALGGVSATGNAGVLAPPVNYTINIDGVSATCAAGTLIASLDQITALTGVAATGSAGTLTQTHSGSLALTGVAATGNVGTLTTQASGNATANLTGAAASGSAGTLALTYSASLTLPSVAATGSAGTVSTNAASNASANLSGVSGAANAGSVSPTYGGSLALTGIGGTGIVGTLSVSGSGNANISLTGVQAIGGVGSLSESAAATTLLIGVSGASAVGALLTSVGKTAQLTGNAGIGQVGTLTAIPESASITLAGVAGQGSVGSLTIRHSASLTLEGVSASGSAGSPYVILKDTTFAPALRTVRVEGSTSRTLKVVASRRTLKVRGD
jgi:hypothetical protein